MIENTSKLRLEDLPPQSLKNDEVMLKAHLNADNLMKDRMKLHRNTRYLPTQIAYFAIKYNRDSKLVANALQASQQTIHNRLVDLSIIPKAEDKYIRFYIWLYEMKSYADSENDPGIYGEVVDRMYKKYGKEDTDTGLNHAKTVENTMWEWVERWGNVDLLARPASPKFSHNRSPIDITMLLDCLLSIMRFDLEQ